MCSCPIIGKQPRSTLRRHISRWCWVASVMEGSAPLMLISTMPAIDSTDGGREAIAIDKFAARAPPQSSPRIRCTIAGQCRCVPCDRFLAFGIQHSVLFCAPFARTCLMCWLFFTWEKHYCAQCTGVCCLSRAGGAPMPVQISDDEGRDRQKLDL